MKLNINTKVIENLSPCSNLLEKWKNHYLDFNEDISVFLTLDEITLDDKLWVVLKLLPKELVETFPLDCAVKAASFICYAAYNRNAGATAPAASTYATYANAAFVAARNAVSSINAANALNSTDEAGAK